MDDIQNILHDKTIGMSDLESIKVIKMKERTNLGPYPDKMQKLIIRAGHYPAYSRKKKSFLYLHNAVDKSSAINLYYDIP